MSSVVGKKLPKHVAVIMDGNRRWAKKKGLPVFAGHAYVLDNVVEKLVEKAGELGIEYVTFWAWSTENWKRGEKEVGAIMKLFRVALKKYARRMIAKGARLKVIGDLAKFPVDIQKGLGEMVEESVENTAITVTFALNYGGRDELVRAVVRGLKEETLRLSDASQSASSTHDDKLVLESLANLSSEGIAKMISENLDTARMPDPDVIIRTGGAQRLSGFMLWQAEYAELMFTETLMPDFGVEEFENLVSEYGERERRLGA